MNIFNMNTLSTYTARETVLPRDSIGTIKNQQCYVNIQGEKQREPRFRATSELWNRLCCYCVLKWHAVIMGTVT